MDNPIFKKEKLLLIIPIHNYLKGVLRLEEFARINLPKLFPEWEISLVNNNSNQDVVNSLNILSKSSNVSLYHSTKTKSLKSTLVEGYVSGCRKIEPTVVAIWETDAIPDFDTFKAMIHLFVERRDLYVQVASVSAMYKWKSEYCYPTHKHWFDDRLYEMNADFGKVTVTHAVPFLFSIWNPICFEHLNNLNFREFVGLDTDFGKHLTSSGFRHLRLINYNIGHEGGGKNSW